VTNDINALIVFVDIRGFTEWSGKIDNSPFLDDFVNNWYGILKTHFKGSFVKPLGDGALIIQNIEERTTQKVLHKCLLEYLEKINEINREFIALCTKFAVEEGTKISLKLGWGIAKGYIKKLKDDYIGADINKCSRYCDAARPYGIVIDADDFKTLPAFPQKFPLEFSRQTRTFKGFSDDTEVWVTKSVAEQFVGREFNKEKPEVHVAGVCCKFEGGKYHILLAKRGKHRHLFPEKYEGCGGQLARNELFTEAVRRHFFLEMGVEVKVLGEHHLFYIIREPNEPLIPGIRFLCEYVGGEPKSENHFPDPRWFAEAELKKIPDDDFIPGLKKQMLTLLKVFKEIKKSPTSPYRAVCGLRAGAAVYRAFCVYRDTKMCLYRHIFPQELAGLANRQLCWRIWDFLYHRRCRFYNGDMFFVVDAPGQSAGGIAGQDGNFAL
jgi:class 3 adenylate cyclase/ADP-ribose pyrophosphatase YjhB (NUDIX family)